MSPPAEAAVRDGYFEPVPDEVTAYDLPVAGTLPPQLTGVYLRNGPNPRPGSAPSGKALAARPPGVSSNCASKSGRAVAGARVAW